MELSFREQGKLHKKRGIFAEEHIKNKLEKRGYKVCKCVNIFPIRKKNSREILKYIIYVKEPKILDFLKDYKGDKEKLLKIMKKHRFGLPDFLVYKNDKLFFLEVKANNSSFSDNQIKVFQMLQEEGYIVRTCNIITPY